MHADKMHKMWNEVKWHKTEKKLWKYCTHNRFCDKLDILKVLYWYVDFVYAGV